MLLKVMSFALLVANAMTSALVTALAASHAPRAFCAAVIGAARRHHPGRRDLPARWRFSAAASQRQSCVAHFGSPDTEFGAREILQTGTV
jgi:hypothetical protein